MKKKMFEETTNVLKKKILWKPSQRKYSEKENFEVHLHG